ncbi:hypothetical protein QT06_C0001G0194 [archaeon GW2011_AR15]|nr:hypothetical protein QT06_C0001G0194 [archaeon GW2011_AR15]
MEPSDLEKILKHLPDPSDVKVELYNFDYSDISRQTGEFLEGLEIDNMRTASLGHATKRDVLELYKKNYEIERKGGSPGVHKANKTPKHEEDEPHYSDLLRVTLGEIEWTLGKNYDVRVKVTPYDVKVEYNGREPRYIAGLRKEVEKIRGVSYEAKAGSDR